MPHNRDVKRMTPTANVHDTVYRGRLPEGRSDGDVLEYVAASPADMRSSFSGSGFPFADAAQAFYNTPNRGKVRVAAGGTFEIKLVSPNSYYVGLGTVIVPPTVHLVYSVGGRRVQRAQPLSASPAVPYRTLTYPASRRCASFYAPESKFVRSQEQILMASGYPVLGAGVPMSFWGGKPAR